MRTIQRTYTQTLDGAIAELVSACRIAADMVDGLAPDMRPADALALQWIVNETERLARDVADCGGPADLTEAGWRLAEAAEAVDGQRTVWAVQGAFDRVEALAGLAAASLLQKHGQGDRITSAWQCPEAQPRFATLREPDGGAAKSSHL